MPGHVYSAQASVFRLRHSPLFLNPLEKRIGLMVSHCRCVGIHIPCSCQTWAVELHLNSGTSLSSDTGRSNGDAAIP